MLYIGRGRGRGEGREGEGQEEERGRGKGRGGEGEGREEGRSHVEHTLVVRAHLMLVASPDKRDSSPHHLISLKHTSQVSWSH